MKDTAFAKRSEIEEAACFHFPGTQYVPLLIFCGLVEDLMLYVDFVLIYFPGYAKTPEFVAGEGIKVRKITIITLAFSSHI